MQKILINLLAVIMVLAIAIAASSQAEAAPAEVPPTNTASVAGPFEGIFYGYINSDTGSRAPMILDLTHTGNIVSGDIYMGEGLVVNGGICGEAAVPSGVQSASGSTLPNNPDQFSTAVEFEVSGIEIGVEINSQVSADGETLAAEAQIDLPWFCGADPEISGTLQRYHPN